LQIATRQLAQAVLARPEGRIDHLSAAAFEAALEPLLVQTGSNALVLDLTAVDYISSVGLRVLMIAAKRLQQSQGRLLVTGVHGVVAEILKISRFDRVLRIVPSLDETLALLDGATPGKAA